MDPGKVGGGEEEITPIRSLIVAIYFVTSFSEGGSGTWGGSS